MSKIVILAIFGFLAVGVGVTYLNSTKQSAMPGHSSVLPDMSNLQQGDPIIDVKLPNSLSATEVMGKTVYNAVCAACHGENGTGVFGLAPPLVYLIYESSHHDDSAFLRAAQNGVTAHHWPFGNMPAQKSLTKADVKSIVAYIRALQRANGIS